MPLLATSMSVTGSPSENLRYKTLYGLATIHSRTGGGTTHRGTSIARRPSDPHLALLPRTSVGPSPSCTHSKSSCGRIVLALGPLMPTDRHLTPRTSSNSIYEIRCLSIETLPAVGTQPPDISLRCDRPFRSLFSEYDCSGAKTATMIK